MAPKVVAVCNITPDSFSGDGWLSGGGNAYTRVHSGNDARLQLESLIAQGADIIDVGAESVLSGAPPVTQEVELARLGPVLEAVKELLGAHPGVCEFSIDTVNSGTAAEAVKCGFTIVNDVSGARRDPAMLEKVAGWPHVRYVMVYSRDPSGRGLDGDGQGDGKEGAAFGRALAFFDEAVPKAERAGIKREQLILDPGVGGFLSADAGDSVNALARIPEMKQRYGLPVHVSASRKSFLRSLVSTDHGPAKRLGASLAAAAFAAERGADFLRVHDVLETKQFLEAAASLHRAAPPQNKT
eukprot:Hpha_TRINITY_DN16867_c2_g4::TRINITY_DN16867_c2_g4_i2::g.149177::m.149177/K00796/folP; dihydropteroate synthase